MCDNKSHNLFPNSTKQEVRDTRNCLGNPELHREKHTVGDYSRWHPHLHALAADGLFTESGYFYVMPKVDLRPLAEIFRASVLKMLQKEGRIGDAFIKMIMAWRHNSGFSVHNEVRIKPGDTKGIENLSQISDQRETSIHHPQHLFARQVELCRKHRNGHLSFR